MAKFDGKFLSGVWRELLFEKSGNQRIVAAKRVSAATKMTAGHVIKMITTFGRTSIPGIYMLNESGKEITGFHDGTMFQRLTTGR